MKKTKCGIVLALTLMLSIGLVNAAKNLKERKANFKVLNDFVILFNEENHEFDEDKFLEGILSQKDIIKFRNQFPKV